MTAWSTHADFQERRKYDEPRCPGTLEIVERGDVTCIVKCDGCDYVAGLPTREVNPAVRVRMARESAGFPAMFAGKPFDDSIANAECKRMFREWIEGYEREPIPAPAVYGRNGRGKSHLLVAACEQLIARYRVSVMFRSAAALLDDLQQSFDDTREHARLWRKLTEVDVLALDDLGAEQPTEWRGERLARLVDERYQNERPILVATNYPPNAWEEMIGARTVSRLLGMTVPVELPGSDHRLRVAA